MSTEKRFSPSDKGAESETIGGGFTFDYTASRPQTAELGRRIRRADAILGDIVDALASGDLSLYELGRYSRSAVDLFNLGHGYGYQAQAERVAQAEWDATRLYAKAYPSENATAVESRMQSAIASTPPGVDPLSPEWMHRALSAAIRGAA